MKAVMQTKRGGPNVPPEERGDCFDACVASILGVPITAVPIAHSDDPEHHWWDAAQEAVGRLGYQLVVADAKCWPWGWWIAAVPSLNLGTYDDGRPVPHVIVMSGGTVAHDPSLGKRYEVGTPIDDLDVMDAYVLVPLEYAVAA